MPLTINNINLSAVLIANEQVDGTFAINCYTTNDYLYQVTHGNNVDTTIANSALAYFFYMENSTFGTTNFYHIPPKLFSHSVSLDADNNKTISIKNNTSTTTSNLIAVICIEYECSICHGNDPDCPLGGHWTVCTTVGGGSSGGSGPGGGSTGSGGGGTGPGGSNGPGNGGGGGGNGGGGNPCPFGGNSWYNLIPGEGPCGPPPPPPPPPQDTILHPCLDIEFLQSSSSFKIYMQELKDSSNSNREYGYLLIKSPAGNFATLL